MHVLFPCLSSFRVLFPCPETTSPRPKSAIRTGEPSNLAREGDPVQVQVGLTPEVGGCARPNHGLTTVVTVAGLPLPRNEPTEPKAR